MSEKETSNISVGDKVYAVPRRHILHYQEAIQQRCIALMEAEAEAGEDIAALTGFTIGDVVSLKSGGPRMTVSRIETYPGKCALIGCVWFTRVNDDVPATTKYPYDGTRYADESCEADFPADCLEY